MRNMMINSNKKGSDRSNISLPEWPVSTGIAKTIARINHMAVDKIWMNRLLFRLVHLVFLRQPVRQPVLRFNKVLSAMSSRDFPIARKEVVIAVMALMTDAINAMFSSIIYSLSLIKIYLIYQKQLLKSLGSREVFYK